MTEPTAAIDLAARPENTDLAARPDGEPDGDLLDGYVSGRHADAEAAVAMWAVTSRAISYRVAAKAVFASQRDDVSPVKWLLDNRHATREQVLALVASGLGFEILELRDSRYQVDVQTVQEAGMATLERARMLPLTGGDRPTVAAANPKDPSVRPALARMYRENAGDVRVMLADPQAIMARLRRIADQVMLDQLRNDDEDDADRGHSAPRSDDDPNIATIAVDESSNISWVKKTLDKAVANRASDIHFSLDARHSLVVRYRVDGEIRQQALPQDGAAERVMNAILQFSNMDIGDQRRTQSTSFDHTTDKGKKISVRAELLPAVTGAKVTWRILDAKAALRRIHDMDLDPSVEDTLKRVMTKRHGLVVTTGPTGSGKTTTQYALLQEVIGRNHEIITIENPVEYKLGGITQVEVNLKSQRGVGWSTAIESCMRSDPDIILVGETRDPATAQSSVQAAMTGHLVLTTLHTTSALGVFSRLMDLGVEPFLVADQLTLALGQRLLPRLHDCATKKPISPREKAMLAAAGITDMDEAFYPVGCELCDHTGFAGRAALVEVLLPDARVKAAVIRRASEAEIYEVCDESNYLPFHVDGARLLREGKTSPDRLLPLLGERSSAIADLDDLPDETAFADDDLSLAGPTAAGSDAA